MWELDYKENWAPKNCCFWTVVLEKTLESPWDCKEIQLVHPKGNQSWIFIKYSLKLKLQYFGHLDAKNWLIRKDPDAAQDWREEKGMTEDEMDGMVSLTWVWASSSSCWWTGEALSAAVLGVAKSQTQLSDWTEMNCASSSQLETWWWLWSMAW